MKFKDLKLSDESYLRDEKLFLAYMRRCKVEEPDKELLKIKRKEEKRILAKRAKAEPKKKAAPKAKKTDSKDPS